MFSSVSLPHPLFFSDCHLSLMNHGGYMLLYFLTPQPVRLLCFSVEVAHLVLSLPFLGFPDIM